MMLQEGPLKEHKESSLLSRCQGTTGEEATHWKDLVYAAVICKVWRLAMAL
jgi:hypothetical protein